MRERTRENEGSERMDIIGSEQNTFRDNKWQRDIGSISESGGRRKWDKVSERKQFVGCSRVLSSARFGGRNKNKNFPREIEMRWRKVIKGRVIEARTLFSPYVLSSSSIFCSFCSFSHLIRKRKDFLSASQTDRFANTFFFYSRYVLKEQF